MDKTLKTEESTSVSRRDFFKRTASMSAVAAASIIAPGTLLAQDDPNIMHHPKWGTTLGEECNYNPYGVPSKYEHNVVRRTSALMSSAGDMHAAISMTPLHEQKGIITPSGLHLLVHTMVWLM